MVEISGCSIAQLASRTERRKVCVCVFVGEGGEGGGGRGGGVTLLTSGTSYNSNGKVVVSDITNGHALLIIFFLLHTPALSSN